MRCASPATSAGAMVAMGYVLGNRHH
jgi:hypothetical protein